jgi:hypothetical protein
MLRIHPEYDIWSCLQKKSGSGFYFNGHNHITSIATRDNWHFVQTPAVLDIPAFRVIEYTDGKLNVQVVPIEDKELLELAVLIGANMKRFKPKEKAFAAGQDSDRSLALEIG